MTTKHTPGDDGFGLRSRAAIDQLRAAAPMLLEALEIAEGWIDAHKRLDLLAALETIHDLFAESLDDWEREDLEALMLRARAAITAAEGE